MEIWDDSQKTRSELLAELQTLRDRLTATEETLRSIQHGEVDALVVSTPEGPRIFTLQTADQSYRLLVEEMQQGAVILSTDGLILYCNQSFASLLQLSLAQLIGSRFQQFLSLNDTLLFQARAIAAAKGNRSFIELCLMAPNGTEIPVYLSTNTLSMNDVSVNCVIITDLTEQKHHESILTAEKMERLVLEQTKEQLEARVAERTAELRQRNAELQQSELILRSFFNSGTMPMGIVELHDDDILHISDNWAAAHFLGTTPDAMRYQYASTLGVPIETIRQWVAYYRQAEQTQMPVRFEYLSTTTEAQRWLSGSVCAIAANPNGYPRFSYIIEDITELKQAEQALRRSEERLQLALEASGDGIWDWNITTNEIYYSPQYFQMLGYKAEELPHTTDTWYQLVHPDDMVWVNELLAKHLQNSSVRYEFDYRLRTKDGGWQWVADYGKVVSRDKQGRPLRMIGTHRDVSERKQTEERIAASLKEKEVLLKEIHHRVKNNLGIVSSLLQMQIRRTQDPQTTVILQDSQNRIASIALLHEKLYRSKDLAQIDCGRYIQDLTTYLFDSYNTSANQIKLTLQVENGHLDIETVIPCGLIINELVSNALKYAFPNNRAGEIQVRFFQTSEATEATEQQRLTLIVKDNGIGLPQNFDIETTKTIGLTLVQGLARQIGATIKVNNQQGTEFEITFIQPNQS